MKNTCKVQADQGNVYYCSLRAKRIRETERKRNCSGLHLRGDEVNILSAESQ